MLFDRHRAGATTDYQWNLLQGNARPDLRALSLCSSFSSGSRISMLNDMRCHQNLVSVNLPAHFPGSGELLAFPWPCNSVVVCRCRCQCQCRQLGLVKLKRLVSKK